MQRRHLSQGLEVGGLARQDVIARDRFERFRGKPQIHRMARLVLKINGQPREDRIHRLDLAEAPASMHGEAALDQLQQRFDMLTADLSGGHQFL